MRDLRNGFLPLSLPPLPPGPTGTPVGPGSFDNRPLDRLRVSPHIPAKPGCRARGAAPGSRENGEPLSIHCRSGLAAASGSALARSPLDSLSENIPPKTVESCRVFCHISIRTGSRFGGSPVAPPVQPDRDGGNGGVRSVVGEAVRRRSNHLRGSGIEGSGSRQQDQGSGASCVAVRKEALARQHCRKRVRVPSRGRSERPLALSVVL